MQRLDPSPVRESQSPPDLESGLQFQPPEYTEHTNAIPTKLGLRGYRWDSSCKFLPFFSYDI